ncbi:MAG: acyl-CoA dehydrogenase family protein [Acidimicrobiales bacterium]|jgi:alkylation response protein AidB-like acyl-CoA dehydrogenase|nr:acyl-CoA dehydrogenase family protein [Acidimicrobiales bacterium]
MDFELPAEDDPRRSAVRAWLAEHPAPTGRELAEAGYVAPHWPAPWGLGADPIHQLVIDDELRRAGVRRPQNMIGIGWAGPTILHAGSDAQKDRYLFPLLAGEEIWCQLFSEPGAGSDLANLATRAVRDGDVYVVNGQKIWTSLAQYASHGILLARTDPDAPKHQGVSYFICPMDAEGVEIRPIIEMTGGHTFNEVFLTDVRIPAENLVGEEHRGWSLAKVTLGNERVSLSGGGALWGNGPSASDLFDLVRGAGGVTDPHHRQRLAQLWIEAEILRLIRLRTVTAAVRGEQPGAEASVRKILADEHGQHLMTLARDLTGTAGLLAAGDADLDDSVLQADGAAWADPAFWYYGFLFSQALTIGGGTGDVQRNIIAERVLGLPHDIDVEAGLAWSEARHLAAAR